MTNTDQSWEELQTRCRDCRACPLGESRTNNVFGTGDRTAALMFVGEAPGEQEDATGIPFVGAAGKLLDRYLFAVDLPRDKVYIANILKCRPPRNRDPEESEQEACIGYLREQFRLIQPKVMVCLGRIAAMKLIKPETTMNKEVALRLSTGNGELFAAKTSDTFEEALLGAIDAIKVQVEKNRNK